MQTLRLSIWHLAIWCTFAVLAGATAVYACRNYNLIASTDKTPEYIALIAASVVTGPYVGPVANSAATDSRAFLPIWTGGLVIAQVLSLLPFIVVRRPGSMAIAITAWLGFSMASGLWFFAAMLSLAHH